MTTAEGPGTPPRKGLLPLPELAELAAILAVVAAARAAALPFVPPGTVAAALFLYVPIVRAGRGPLPPWLATAGPAPARAALLTAALLLASAGAFLLWLRLPLPAGLLPPPGAAPPPWGRIVPAAAVTALSEEVYFRGRLHDALAARGLPAVPAGALLFALAHVALLPTPYRALTILPGLLLGWLRQRTGTVYAPAALHFAFNLLPPLAGGAP